MTFDFSSKPLKPDQIEKVERMTQLRLKEDLEVFAKAVALKQAKEISSLRAVFGEKYPDPVRVVSIGVDVDTLLANPSNEEWWDYSVELCGGTHLKSLKEGTAFVLCKEEGTAKGTRRVTCVTGLEALKANETADQLEVQLDEMKSFEGEKLESALKKFDEAITATTREDGSPISHTRRLALVKQSKKLNQQLNKQKQKRQKEITQRGLEEAKTMVEEHKKSSNVPFLVTRIDVGTNVKNVKKICESVSKGLPDQPVMVFSGDANAPKAKVLVCCMVPKAIMERFLEDQWIKSVMEILGGNGGGKKGVAQGQALNYEWINDGMLQSGEWMAQKLG